jgi:hypothetical protein
MMEVVESRVSTHCLRWMLFMSDEEAMNPLSRDYELSYSTPHAYVVLRDSCM